MVCVDICCPFLMQFWEECPDIYGIRRSGRNRRVPERLDVEVEVKRLTMCFGVESSNSGLMLMFLQNGRPSGIGSKWRERYSSVYCAGMNSECNFYD